MGSLGGVAAVTKFLCFETRGTWVKSPKSMFILLIYCMLVGSVGWAPACGIGLRSWGQATAATILRD